MKNILFTTVLSLLLSSFSVYAQNAEKTLVKAFNLQGNHQVILDVAGEVDIQTWDQETMRVMMTISLPTGSDIMLKSLVKVGRYNLDAAEEEGGLKVFAPGLEKQVKLRNGTELEENISMVVFMPADVQVTTANELSLLSSNENE